MPGSNPIGLDQVVIQDLFLLPYNAVQGTWTRGYLASAIMGQQFYNSTSADADEVEIRRYFAGGTYSIRLIAKKSSSSGIIKVSIGGTLVLTQDLYNATNVLNFEADDTGLSIAAGIKTISLKVDGKNASSSNYYAYLQALTLVKTS